MVSTRRGNTRHERTEGEIGKCHCGLRGRICTCIERGRHDVHSWIGTGLCQYWNVDALDLGALVDQLTVTPVGVDTAIKVVIGPVPVEAFMSCGSSKPWC